MDNITQWVIWWSLYTLITGKKTNKQFMLGAFISNIPDLDTFIAAFVSTNRVDQFFFHREIMHSIIFNFWLSLILWFILYRGDRTRPYRRYVLASFISIFCGHLLIDGMTSYGMRYFLPWDSTVYSWDNMFVIDFGMRAITIIGFIRYLFSAYKSKIAKWILIIVWAYITLSVWIQYHADNLFTKQYPASIEKSGIIKSITMATPLQIALRKHIVKTPTGIYEGYYSIFDKQTNEIERNFSPFDLAAQEKIETLSLENNHFGKQLTKVLNFSRDMFLVTSNASGYNIESLLMGSFDNQKNTTWTQSIFGFKVTNLSGSYELSQSRWWGSISSKAWNDLRKRAWGQ